jgi:hypothetical protein
LTQTGFLVPFANHTYPEFREYNITLEVCDDDSACDTGVCKVLPKEIKADDFYMNGD